MQSHTYDIKQEATQYLSLAKDGSFLEQQILNSLPLTSFKKLTAEFQFEKTCINILINQKQNEPQQKISSK